MQLALQLVKLFGFFPRNRFLFSEFDFSLFPSTYWTNIALIYKFYHKNICLALEVCVCGLRVRSFQPKIENCHGHEILFDSFCSIKAGVRIAGNHIITVLLHNMPFHYPLFTKMTVCRNKRTRSFGSNDFICTCSALRRCLPKIFANVLFSSVLFLMKCVSVTYWVYIFEWNRSRTWRLWCAPTLSGICVGIPFGCQSVKRTGKSSWRASSAVTRNVTSSRRTKLFRQSQMERHVRRWLAPRAGM